MKSSTWHRVRVTDPEAKAGNCSVCGDGVPLRRRVRRGRVEWSCMTRHLEYSGSSGNGAGNPHRAWVASSCWLCGFRPIHLSQLDVHHLDGDHANNEVQNLVTLCANCHRLWHAMGPEGIALAEEAGHLDGVEGFGRLALEGRELPYIVAALPEGRDAA